VFDIGAKANRGLRTIAIAKIAEGARAARSTSVFALAQVNSELLEEAREPSQRPVKVALL
jgi:hypothetical protein